MILNAFAKYLQESSNNIPPQVLLSKWLREILKKKPQTNVEKIIHCELTLIEKPDGSYAVVGSDIRGQKLLEVLFKYSSIYETNVFSKWINNRKPNDFTKGQDTENLQ